MKDYLLVCEILKPLGLKGDVKVFSYTSFPEIRYKKGNVLFLKNGDEYQPLKIKSSSSKGGNIDILSFEEFEDINLITPFIGKELFAIKDEKILNKNEFYYSDLISLKVFDENHNELGIVTSIEEFPAQITLKISKKDAKKHFFVPFNDFFIKEINIKEGYLILHLIDGLIE